LMIPAWKMPHLTASCHSYGVTEQQKIWRGKSDAEKREFIYNFIYFLFATLGQTTKEF
jgi:hypothetical protein